MNRYEDDVNIVAFGNTLATDTDTIAISTNCPATYNIYVTGTETGGTSLSLEDNSDSIPASSNTIGHEGTLAANSWGIGTDGTKFAGVQEYNSNTAALTPLYVGSGNHDYSIHYGAYVPANKKSGVYSGEIIYTVIMNDACLRYTLDFDTNNATSSTLPTGDDRLKIDFDSPVDLAEYSTTQKIARTGYQLSGWDVKDGSGAIISTNLPTDSNTVIDDGRSTIITLVAKWAANSYTVAYAAGNTGGTCSVSSTSATYDANVTLSSTKCTKEGYTQDGWSTKADGSTKDYDLGATLTKPNFTSTNNGTYTLYPHFAINSHTLTVSGGIIGTSGSTTSQSVNYNASVTIKANTPAAGYHFTSWSSNNGGTFASATSSQTTFTMPDADVTVTAGTAANSYKIAYAAGSTGSSCSISNTNATYDQNVTLSSTKCTKEGYTQDGWSTKADGSTKDYDLGATLTKPNFTSTNNGTYTLYPHYAANTYTIAYNANAPSGKTATGSTSNTTGATYGSTVALRANGYSVDGYNFLGWAYSSSATAKDFNNAQTGVSVTTLATNNASGSVVNTNNATITLYAVWEQAIQYMQDISAADLPESQTSTVADKRDNQEYTVYRWPSSGTAGTSYPTGMAGYAIMTQDLSLGYVSGGSTTKGANLVLDTTNSAAAGTITARTGTDDWSTTNSDDNLQYINGTGGTYDSHSYYSYGAAQKVCPKGWRLPTQTEYNNIATFMGGNSSTGSTNIRSAPYNFVYGGNFYSSGWNSVGSSGYYWSSTQRNSTYGYYLSFSSSSMYTYDINKNYGRPVRCVAQ